MHLSRSRLPFISLQVLDFVSGYVSLMSLAVSASQEAIAFSSHT